MIRSKHRAARSALVLAATSYLLLPVDFALQKLEKRLVAKSPASSLPMILIIGGSRSGTTLVYQTLTRYLPVSYFSNWSSLFQRSPILASRFIKPGQSRAADFNSFYGNTAGMRSPNDGFHVWNRWLGEDRYRAPKDLLDDTKREMKAFFDAWLTTTERPLVNKNNRNTDCAPLLASVLDNAYFVAVRRDPLFVAQSLLQARLDVQGDKKIGWGLGGRDSDAGEGEFAYLDDICDQVIEVERKHRENRQLIGERLIEVSYEDFCIDPVRIVTDIHRKVFADAKNLLDMSELKAFNATNRIRIDQAEFERLQARITTALEKLNAEPSAEPIKRKGMNHAGRG